MLVVSGALLGKARLVLALLTLLSLLASFTSSIASCQELVYEFGVEGLGVVKFALVVDDEWVFSKPFMVGYALSIEGNSSVIGVLRLVFKCGDTVSSNDYLLGLVGKGERLSSLIAVRPTASLLHCEEDYVVLEPTLLLYKLGDGLSKQYSYPLSPLIVKLVKSVESTHTSSCRVSVENGTALELCIETVQPWTPTSTARLLVSLHSTKALEDVVVGVRVGEWLLASRIVDLTTASARAQFFVEQRILAALWRGDGSLTLTGYAKAGKLYVETPLEIVLEKPNVRLLVDVETSKLVAGVPSTVVVRITNAWTKSVVVKGVELVFNETKLWFEVGEKLATLDSLTVEREVVVNKTGTTTLEVRVCYAAGLGVSGCVEKRVNVEIASPLKILSLEPSIVEANKTIRVTVLSLIDSHNATLLAYPAGGGKPIVLAKGLYLGRNIPATFELVARLEPGEYLVKIVDEHGYESNPLRLKVVESKPTGEYRIAVIPLQTSAVTGEIVEVRVAISPPRNATFKLYRLVEMPKPQWVREHILEVVEESSGTYVVRYRAPSRPGTYTYKLVVAVNGVEKEAQFTLEVEKRESRNLQLSPLQEIISSQQLLPNWLLYTLIATSITFGLILFRRYGRGA